MVIIRDGGGGAAVVWIISGKDKETEFSAAEEIG